MTDAYSEVENDDSQVIPFDELDFDKIIEGIIEVRNSGATNMLDTLGVSKAADYMGWHDLADFAFWHPKEYGAFLISNGESMGKEIFV